MDTATRVQILDETAFPMALLPLRKGMNPTILHLAMGKYLGKLDFSTLLWIPVYEKENSEFKPIKLRLKIHLVSLPTYAER